MARGIPRICTFVLITIHSILKHFCRFTECMAEPASLGRPEDPIAQQRDWLLEELNGAHLRLSASVVCYHIAP